ncbi:MAG: rhomboid family intramembrane serine protease [Promethearchaeota archaeon]|jgi:rhomboid protease GluP
MILLDIKDLRKAKITLALIFINILCFLSFNIAMPMEYFYLFVQINSRILNEYEIWRLFTSLFLHADILHLVSNLLALLIFGATIELHPKFSKLFYVITFIISGLIGNIFSLILLLPNTISLGASGSIFGLIGVVLIIIASENRSLLPFALLYIAYYIVASFSPGINIWAHLTGLIGGISLGYMLYYRKNRVEQSFD